MERRYAFLIPTGEKGPVTLTVDFCSASRTPAWCASRETPTSRPGSERSSFSRTEMNPACGPP